MVRALSQLANSGLVFPFRRGSSFRLSSRLAETREDGEKTASDSADQAKGGGQKFLGTIAPSWDCLLRPDVGLGDGTVAELGLKGPKRRKIDTGLDSDGDGSLRLREEKGTTHKDKLTTAVLQRRQKNARRCQE